MLFCLGVDNIVDGDEMEVSHCIEGVVYIAVAFAAKTNGRIPLVVIDLIYKLYELFYCVRKIKVSDMETECML